MFSSKIKKLLSIKKIKKKINIIRVYNFKDFDFSKRSFKHLKSIISRAIKKNKKEVVEKTINNFFEKIKSEQKSKSDYKKELSEYLLYAVKHNNNEITKTIISIYKKNNISFFPEGKGSRYKESDGFKNVYKMYVIADKKNNLPMLSELLNDRLFCWMFTTFPRELLKSTVKRAALEKNYKKYKMILNSLNIRANHKTFDMREESSIIAAKNGDFNFFKNNEYAISIKNLDQRDYERYYRESISKMLFSAIENGKNEMAEAIFETIYEKNKYDLLQLIDEEYNEYYNKDIKKLMDIIINKNNIELFEIVVIKIAEYLSYRLYEKNEQEKEQDIYFQKDLFKKIFKNKNKEFLKIYYENLGLPNTNFISKILISNSKENPDFIVFFKSLLSSRRINELKETFKQIELSKKLDNF